MADGFIYAIGPSFDGPVKIGITTRSVDSRLKNIQTSHHSKLSILGCVGIEERSSLTKIERSIHKNLKTHHLYGEWFAVSMDQNILEILVYEAQEEIEKQRISQEIIEEDSTFLFDKDDMKFLFNYNIGEDIQVQIALGLREEYADVLEDTKKFVAEILKTF